MKRQKAFTLIELLVVVSIIALLVSILLPALGKAREQAKTAVCASNMHQLAILSQTYIAENDRWPAYWDMSKGAAAGLWYVSDGNNGNGFFYSWMDFLQGRGAPNPDLYDCPKLPDNPNPRTGFQLPADYPSDVQLSTNYGYNLWLALGGSGGVGFMAGKVKRPAQKIAFGDSWWANGGYTYYYAGIFQHAMGPEYSGLEWTRFPHGNRVNVVFADCHYGTLAPVSSNWQELDLTDPANHPDWFSDSYWLPNE